MTQARPISIPFSRIEPNGTELRHIASAIERGDLAGGGEDAAACSRRLTELTGAADITLTPSGTHALELAALVLGLSPGDEVVMPSWTFVSTANAVVLRGATPVWADVTPETLTLDPGAVAAAITERTRAIVVVHYGGVAADMDALLALAEAHDIPLVEDAAHCLLARWRGRALGTLGALGCLSFDAQKNVTSGEGGALLVGAPALARAAEQAASKGTNRPALMRGDESEYHWLGPGSAWELGGLAAAFLRGQLDQAQHRTERRLQIWTRYAEALASLEADGVVALARVPPEADPNGHLFWLVLDDREQRDSFIAGMRERGIEAPFHYVPLHRSPAARSFARAGGGLPVTEHAGDGLVRLPLWPGMSDDDVETVASTAARVIGRLAAQNGSRSSDELIRSGSDARAE